MKLPRAIAWLGLWALLATPDAAFAQRLEDTFASGNEAAYRGDWDAAASEYEKLLSAGVDDADVHFNLGVAHGHRGQLGRAALCFERSLRLAPGDPAASEALSLTQAALGHRRAEREGEATVRTRPPLSEAVVQRFSEAFLARLLLGLDALLFALLILLRYARTEASSIGLSIGWPLAALACVVTAGALLVKTEAVQDGRAGLVLREGAELREGPHPHAQVRGTAPEGAYARVLEHESDYARVLVGGRAGWMRLDDVAEIRPD